MKESKFNSRFASMVAAFVLFIGVFHLVNVAGLLSLSTMDIRIIHLAIMLVIVFLSYPLFKGNNVTGSSDLSPNSPSLVTQLIPALFSLAVSVYFLSRWKAIALSGGDTNSLDLLMGILLLAIVLEATRRAIGLVLAIITFCFLVYPFISPYLPGVLHGRGVNANRVANFLTTTSEGIYGIPLGVAATYIIIFSLYGAFLNQFGAGDFFFKLASGVTKGMRAASAKTAVIFSSLLGMISGSAAGNVAVTGSFTIPMMKKEGYQPRQAAAIEAVVSTGGQILPPIMGAAAFIMAEIVGTPYVNVMKAAVIPALLFFLSIIFVVHFQAKLNGIEPAAVAETPSEPILQTLWQGVPFLAPFALLIVLMVEGYSPFKACFYSLLLLVLLVALWEKEFGMSLLKKISEAIQKGVKSTVPIAIACAAAGIISGSLAVSGLGIKISSIIISSSGGIAIVALVLTMFTAIVLGMGLPTTAAYLILATVVAPSLAELGVPLLTAHLFVFFFGCVSTITPPVALASYVAAGIANADINKVGWTAFAYGITSFVLPYMFFFGPALMMNDTGIAILLAIVSGIVGVYFVAMAVVGYGKSRLTILSRLSVFLAGILLLLQGWQTDLAGVVIGLFTLSITASLQNKDSAT
ncbi:MAG: TRAP transporter fused permease subunit [Acidiferrobacterales bacterium]|nr:TRAP transporter fused permease subunit [Acidiferrobacterales bacterium]